MAYQATVIPIMIASPGDVQMERNIIRDVILEWNNVHAFEEKVILDPVGWDTHSSPELADRPQELINTRQLKKCDLLVGVFGTKLGTPTETAKSGTIEEIEEHHSTGKPVMLYFSSKDIPRVEYDKMQIEEVDSFKYECRKHGIVEDFESDAELEKKFAKQLQIALNDNPHLKSLLSNRGNDPEASAFEQNMFYSKYDLSEEEKTLLIASAKDKTGLIIESQALGYGGFIVGFETFGEGSAKEMAKWTHIISQLVEKGLFQQAEGEKAYELTHKGWNTIEILRSESEDA